MSELEKALEDIDFMRATMEKSQEIAPHQPAPLRGMSLHALEAELYAAHEAISDALERGEEPSPQALATVNEYALAAAEKRDATAAVLRRLDAEIEYADAEIKRLQALKHSREANAARLRGMILTVMREHGVEKIRGNTTTFSVVQNPPSVEVDDTCGALPQEFVRVIPASEEPDKVKIREALKSGQTVPGARLVQGSYRLVIR